MEEGVDTIFGYPGGAVIDIYDGLIRSPINHILVRHEQGAVHAADGYARASGKVGVCIVTSGPGATNTVTGIASAYMDSSPIVVFTGQVPTSMIGNNAFQEVDIIGITKPCTKRNYHVRDVDCLKRIIKEAFYVARLGRPGPVLVDIPKDIMTKEADYRETDDIGLRSRGPISIPDIEQLERAVELIKSAERPLILSGGGVILSGGSKELRAFARGIVSPVASTLMGLGTYPPDGRLWLGMIGMHGTYCANMASAYCDLLIAIGVRFDDRATGRGDTFAPNAKIIHMDIDPTFVHKNISVDVSIVGDCKVTLSMLNEMLKGVDMSTLNVKREAWLSQIQKWKDTNPLTYRQGDSIKPQFVIEKLYELTRGNAVVATEVGQNQMWTAQYYHFRRPNALITSGGLGCMGFGLPAAIGAQIARPSDLVIDIAGDGSIQMNIQELATAVQYSLPIKVVILNNEYLGMVRQWQELFYNRNYAFTKLEASPDFVRLAEAYGAVGFRANRVDEVIPVLKKGLSMDCPVVMDFHVEREENVFPMVPAGASITEMLTV